MKFDLSERRVIKFRGKSTVDGQWVYGYYLMRHGINEILTPSGTVPVHPWSVGQFVGIKNKQGTELYEGDIVEAWSTGSKATFQIKWRQTGAPMFILYPNFQHGEHWYWNLHGSNVGEKDKGNYVDDLKVVGTIHDNGYVTQHLQ